MLKELRRSLHILSGKLQRLITPGLRHSQETYRELLQEKVTPGSDWLDIGCGHKVFAEWLTESLHSERDLVSRCHKAIGVDCADERPHRSLQTKYYATAEKLPFTDCSFSIATANMVVEHLADPNAALSEIYRVLRPGGLFVFHTPNVRSPLISLTRAVPFRITKSLVSFIYGRHGDDVFPTYYRLNEVDSIRSVAESNGFLVSALAFVETAPVLVMLGPLVLFELLTILLLRRKTFANLRPDLLVVLQKQPGLPLSDKSAITS